MPPAEDRLQPLKQRLPRIPLPTPIRAKSARIGDPGFAYPAPSAPEGSWARISPALRAPSFGVPALMEAEHHVGFLNRASAYHPRVVRPTGRDLGLKRILLLALAGCRKSEKSRIVVLRVTYENRLFVTILLATIG